MPFSKWLRGRRAAPLSRIKTLFAAPPRSAGRRPKIVYPFEPAPEIAVFETLPPPGIYQALAAPLPILRSLTIRRRGVQVTHALLVLTGANGRDLDEEDLELFWRIFRVPVFEQLLGPEGELLAWECEAHEGLHVACGATIRAADETIGFAGTGLTGTLVHGDCPCGKAGPRVFGLRAAGTGEGALSSAAD